MGFHSRWSRPRGGLARTPLSGVFCPLVRRRRRPRLHFLPTPPDSARLTTARTQGRTDRDPTNVPTVPDPGAAAERGKKCAKLLSGAGLTCGSIFFLGVVRVVAQSGFFPIGVAAPSAALHVRRQRGEKEECAPFRCSRQSRRGQQPVVQRRQRPPRPHARKRERGARTQRERAGRRPSPAPSASPFRATSPVALIRLVCRQAGHRLRRRRASRDPARANPISVRRWRRGTANGPLLPGSPDPAFWAASAGGSR